MRFIGNKTRLLDEIDSFLKDNNISGKVFCDIFSGSSSVGDYFKSNYKIISNDFLKFSTDISKAKLLNSKIPNFEKFQKKYKKEPFEYLNGIEIKYSNNFYVTDNYSPKGNRKYFTEKNATRIDGIRILIEEFYKNQIIENNEYYFLLGSLLESAMRFSNTTGTYEAYLKNWDSRSIKDFLLLPIEFNSCKIIKDNEVYNEDANFIIRTIKGDVLYIDPPYTITEYSSAYHVLETISRYDFPEVTGITGRRIINDRKSTYTRKKEAIYAFEDLIKQAQFDHIVISYSNESLIPLDELKLMLNKYSISGSVVEKKILYRKYKNIRESKKGKELFEVLLYFKKDNRIIKSPLNYSGSKNRLMPQIITHLPVNIDTFIDVMGGAFNVGINIVANKVIYNEYNNYVYGIIKYLLESNPSKVLSYSKKNIREFNLDNGKKIAYNDFRSKYNKNQKPKDLFILSMFAFQNQLRFNSNFKFNTPVGNCGFNETLENRILNFKPRTNNFELLNLDFNDLDCSKYSKESLFYFDPPYFITNASYNDGKRGFNGWDADLETKLLSYITLLHNNGYKFMLSNVIYHKNKTNHILKEWIETHSFNVHELSSGVRREVLITNYERIKGRR